MAALGVVQLRAAGRVGSPGGISAPPDGYATWDEYMLENEADAVRESAWRRDQDATRGLKAVRLATSLAVCRALLAGQRVPADALDPQWRRRYFTR